MDVSLPYSERQVVRAQSLHGWSGALGRRLVAAALIGVLALSLPTAIQGFYVQGMSMAPTLHPGQLVLVNKTATVFGSHTRGDFVVFDSPTSPGQTFVKRLIGLPGDRVLIDAGRVFVNDQPLDEPYVQFAGDYTYPADGRPLTVPEDRFFVLGDNRPNSADSHLGWVVPADKLVGQGFPLPWLSWTTATVAPDASDLTPGPLPRTGQDSRPVADDSGPVTGPDLADLAAGVAPTAGPADTAGADPGLALPSTWTRNRFANDQAGQFAALGAPLVDVPADVTVSANFRKVGGPPGGGYGFVLRNQNPASLDGQNQTGNYYVLEAGDRGDIGVWRRDGERWVDLVSWTHADAVRPGGADNILTARAVGGHLTLIVNGVTVAELNDATLAAGSVGVFVGGDGNDVAVERFTVAAASSTELTATERPAVATPTPPREAEPAVVAQNAEPAIAAQKAQVETPRLEAGTSLLPALPDAHVRTAEAGRFVALGIPAGDVPADVTLSATVRKVGGPPGGGYGLILRNQSPAPLDGQTQAGDYYVLGAGDRGDVGVWRREGERWIDLVPWTHSDVVREGDASNDLTARIVGHHLTLLVNGVQVAEVIDATLADGGVGVFVGGDGNEVAFERLDIQAP